MKKVMLSIVAILMVAGTIVYATTPNKTNDCCGTGAACCYPGSPCCTK